MSCPSSPHDHAMSNADPLSADVFRAFKRVMHLNRQYLMRTASEMGSHPAQIGCTMVLAHHDNLSQRELAQRLHIAPATLTTMLQRMEKNGLVERYVDPDDQRLTRVHLTRGGREQAEAHAKAHAESVEAGLGSMSAEDRKELARLLDLVGDNIAKELDR